jgi:hypothetical protein
MLSTSSTNNSKLNTTYLNQFVHQYPPLKGENIIEQYHNLNYQSSTNDFEDDSDISNEVNAELKITKIDKKL